LRRAAQRFGNSIADGDRGERAVCFSRAKKSRDPSAGAVAVLDAILNDEVRAARIVASDGLHECESLCAKRVHQRCGARMKTVEAVEIDRIANRERWARAKICGVSVRHEQIERVGPAAKKNTNENGFHSAPLECGRGQNERDDLAAIA